jgi:hypothetical protein
MRGGVAERYNHVADPNDDLGLHDQAYWGIGGDPVKFFKVFTRIAMHPRRATIGWDIQMLDWMIRAWEAAAIATVGDDAVKHELARYRHLRKGLADGMHERKDSGHVFLTEPEDWPHPRTVLKAMFALEHAEVREIQ